MKRGELKEIIKEVVISEISKKWYIQSTIEFFEGDPALDEEHTIKIKPHELSDIEIVVQKEYKQAETKKLEKELSSLIEKTIRTFIKKSIK